MKSVALTLPKVQIQTMKLNWDLPLKYAYECEPCHLCDRPWCAECGAHYADCAHPGPHSEPDEDLPKEIKGGESRDNTAARKAAEEYLKKTADWRDER